MESASDASEDVCPRKVSRQNVKEKKQKSQGELEFGWRRDGHDLAARPGVCGFFVRFFVNSIFENFQKS